MSDKILFIFIDGLAIPDKIDTNHLSIFPTISDILESSKPIDPVMGVEGTPQSGTGQTSLFCGINAQKHIGRHQYAFPCKKLRKLIEEKNIFSDLKKKNKKFCFANAYHTSYFAKESQRHSVSTWMCIYSNFDFLTEDDLLKDNAVYHDITNKNYIDGCVPLKSPKKAAENLLKISLQNDFTLFEYFLSDRAGHKRVEIDIIKELDGFLKELLSMIPKDIGLIITSDHGNIEDLTSKSHTKNPVPFFTKNLPLDNLPEDLSEVKDYILDALHL